MFLATVPALDNISVQVITAVQNLWLLYSYKYKIITTLFTVRIKNVIGHNMNNLMIFNQSVSLDILFSATLLYVC